MLQTLDPAMSIHILCSIPSGKYMDVSENRVFPPKSSILIGFSIINHPFWGTPIFGNIHMFTYIFQERTWKNLASWFISCFLLLLFKKASSDMFFRGKPHSFSLIPLLAIQQNIQILKMQVLGSWKSLPNKRPFLETTWKFTTRTFPKIVGFSPQIIHFNRVFDYFHHPFGGVSPYFLRETPIKMSHGNWLIHGPLSTSSIRPWFRTTQYWDIFAFPIGSMYGIFTYIYHRN